MTQSLELVKQIAVAYTTLVMILVCCLIALAAVLEIRWFNRDIWPRWWRFWEW